MSELRKSIEVEVLDQTVSIDVDWRIIDVVETVYDMRAEYVAVLLQNPVKIKRKDIADVLTSWLAPRIQSISRKAIREAVLLADDEPLTRYIGAIQGAVLYALRKIDGHEFDRLIAGRDLDDDGSRSKKKPRRKKATRSSRTPTA